MKGIQDFAQYSIFKLLQLLWDYYDHVRYCSLWGYEVYYFYYIRCCTEICFQKGDNDLPDFYFVHDKIQQRVELSSPGINKEKIMEIWKKLWKKLW